MNEVYERRDLIVWQPLKPGQLGAMYVIGYGVELLNLVSWELCM
jgi:hypothetical protein